MILRHTKTVSFIASLLSSCWYVERLAGVVGFAPSYMYMVSVLCTVSDLGGTIVYVAQLAYGQSMQLIQNEILRNVEI